MKFKAYLTAAVIAAFLFTTVFSFSNVEAQDKPTTGQKPKAQQEKKAAEPEEPQDEQVIKLGAQLVTVPFNVNDKTNRYINDLTKDDIEITEDNKPQQVFSFERQTDLPITVAMAIDISGSQQFTLPYEVAAGKRFFQKVLRPKKDLGAVITFQHESVLVQDLTSDVGRLLAALDDVRVPAEMATVRTGGTPPINNSGVGSTAMHDSVYSISGDLLRREAGRRVIILITDGQDTSSSVKMKEAIERTWRNEIIIYSIGIGDPAFDGVDKGTLKKYAAETGGRAFFPRNEEDLDKAFAQIDEDLRSQYIVTYEPANATKDGSFRTIQMKVKNRKDLTVRHRRGYFAPKAE
jgi:Ca-activated chloride channel homolog